VVNATPEAISTALTFTAHGIPSDTVSTLLRGLAMDNSGIAIAPRSTTRVDMACNLTLPYRALDFRVHYVLPHFHGFATGFELSVFGGPNDGALVYGTDIGIGDPLGGRIDPPLTLEGATGLRMTCTYENPGDAAVNWGVNQEDEMCVVLAFIDSRAELAGTSMGAVETTTDADGVVTQTSLCTAIAIRD
jgi:hypothetical protein